MLAMETLATRVHDDRPQAKYAANPPYGDDVKWLLRKFNGRRKYICLQLLVQSNGMCFSSSRTCHEAWQPLLAPVLHLRSPQRGQPVRVARNCTGSWHVPVTPIRERCRGRARSRWDGHLLPSRDWPWASWRLPFLGNGRLGYRLAVWSDGRSSGWTHGRSLAWWDGPQRRGGVTGSALFAHAYSPSA